jgi:hypothetical protein
VSLSNLQVVALLNRYYVPVYVSNEDYQGNGTAPPEEKAELRRIFQEGYAAKLSVGTVHVYILKPDGHTLDSMHVAEAAKAEKLIAMLERDVKTLGTTAGMPVIAPTPPPAPTVAPGSLLLHLTSRYLERRGDDYKLIEDAGGNWSALPSEDWIPLAPAEWQRWLPAGKIYPGLSWQVDGEQASALLKHFYPPTENSDLKTNRMDQAVLKGTVTTVRSGVALIRLEGSLKMKHPFYHKDDNNFAQASVVGYLEYDTAKKQFRSFHLVTEEASYGDTHTQPYGVAVHAVFAGR